MCLVLICQSPEMEKEVVSWAVHAFFRYDTQNSNSPAAGLTTTASQTSAPVARIPDTSFVFSGPAASGSTHGSYLASPIQLKRSVSRQSCANCFFCFLRYSTTGSQDKEWIEHSFVSGAKYLKPLILLCTRSSNMASKEILFGSIKSIL